MDMQLWIAFALASAALLAIPGPTVVLVISYALGRGRQSGWATVPAVALGDLTAMSVSLMGAGAVLAASATAFTVLKLVGAAYLVWMGFKLWRAPVEAGFDQMQPVEARGMFWNAYIVTALNPKSIVFFIAFVPQFIDAGGAFAPQVVVLVTTFVLLASINAALWAVLVGRMRAQFSKPRTLRLINRIGGSFLIGAGAVTALARRA